MVLRGRKEGWRERGIGLWGGRRNTPGYSAILFFAFAFFYLTGRGGYDGSFYHHLLCPGGHFGVVVEICDVP